MTAETTPITPTTDRDAVTDGLTHLHERVAAIDAALAALATEADAISFDVALGEPVATARAAAISAAVAARHTERAGLVVAVAEGERRLAMHAREEAAAHRATLEADYGRCVDARETAYIALESAMETLLAAITSALDTGRAVQAAGAPLSRRDPVPAAAEITRYVGRTLAEAGLGLGGEYLAHQSFAGPLSAAKRQVEALDARRELWDRGVRERRRSAHKERRPQ